MKFSRKEYWSELPYTPPGDLSNPGIKPRSPVLQVDSLPSEPPGKTLSGYGGAQISISTKWLDDTDAPGLRSHFENHNLRLMLLRMKYILNDQKYS